MPFTYRTVKAGAWSFRYLTAQNHDLVTCAMIRSQIYSKNNLTEIRISNIVRPCSANIEVEQIKILSSYIDKLVLLYLQSGREPK